MKRKITILTIAFLSSMLMYANAFAAATGRCGDSITWTLDDSGNLTLSGSGEMWNNGYDDSPFKDYEIRKATVKYGITSIGESAFLGCRGMTELILPNSVTSIGNYAFSDCSGLEKITVDRGNKRYDSWGNCNSIIETGTNTLIVGCKNSVIPNSVTSIGYYAFYGCSGLTELTLPDSVASIGDGAFICCSDLSKITSLAEIPPVCGSGVFDRVNKTNCELIVLEGSVAAYTQAKGWKEFSNIRGFSGVEVTVAEGNTIRAIGNQIEVSGDFTSVEVYGINGALIYKGKDNVVTVPSAGIYLVHVAGETRKIVVE